MAASGRLRFVLRKFVADVGTLTPGNAWLRDAMRLSQLNVNSVRLNALFFTHMHSDHTEGFADFLHHRWAWDSRRPKLDIVCSADVASQFGFSISRQDSSRTLAMHSCNPGKLLSDGSVFELRDFPEAHRNTARGADIASNARLRTENPCDCEPHSQFGGWVAERRRSC